METEKQTEALAKPQREPLAFIPKNLDDAWRISELLSKAGVIPDALRGQPHNVLAIVMTGAELGLSPMQSIRNIDIVKGRPFLESLLRMAMVKQSPDCEYFKLIETTNLKAVFETKRRGEGVTRMEYTVEDARAAGAIPARPDSNWAKDLALMLRRRCGGRLADEVYSDVTRGVGDRSEIEHEKELNAKPTTFAPPKPPPVDAEVVPPSPPAPKGKKKVAIVDVPSADEHAAQEAAARDAETAPPTPPKPEALDVPGLLMRLAGAQTEADVDALAPLAQKVQGPDRSRLSAAFKARRLDLTKGFVQGGVSP